LTPRYAGQAGWVTEGCLGVHGKGLAPHWRLTEMPYAGNPPTREFMNWDGVLFESKKQNPVPVVCTPRTSGGYIQRRPKMPNQPDRCTTGGYITTLTTTEADSRLSKPPWTTPTLTEIFPTPDELQALREPSSG
jgi:hypothetical protein